MGKGNYRGGGQLVGPGKGPVVKTARGGRGTFGINDDRALQRLGQARRDARERARIRATEGKLRAMARAIREEEGRAHYARLVASRKGLLDDGPDQSS